SAYTALLLRLVGVPRRGGWSSDDEGHRIIESRWAQLFATSVFHQNRQFNSLNLVDVFRCSADVEQHPQKLLINVEQEDRDYVARLLGEATFTNTGPLVMLQAGASQAKRQWAPAKFIQLVKILTEQHNCRVVLTGTSKELSIIEPIQAGTNSKNVFVAAGKTNIPQLTAMLEMSDILVTGDTGPMHISVAVGTPVVSMFLASAFGFETGPYSEGNIVLQPIIGCGPCNPNKLCSRPDCHDCISPELIAELTMMRLKEDFKTLPSGFQGAKDVHIYRSTFDQYGFCDLVPLVHHSDWHQKYREAYRKLWLEDLGGFPQGRSEAVPRNTFQIVDSALEGINDIAVLAEQGARTIEELQRYIRDTTAPAALLGATTDKLGELDRKIEEIGFYYPYLGPLSRMFLFAKENISGTDAGDLASQMGRNYSDLSTRALALSQFYSTL
ncbi:MAG: glycosyltransferase family 9 protein, partial [Bdellovibrionales bacterium]|nr:glycosyltransferase family 9 protein [Bdellovibrionales bacterium]